MTVGIRCLRAKPESGDDVCVCVCVCVCDIVCRIDSAG